MRPSLIMALYPMSSSSCAAGPVRRIARRPAIARGRGGSGLRPLPDRPWLAVQQCPPDEWGAELEYWRVLVPSRPAWSGGGRRAWLSPAWPWARRLAPARYW